MHNAPAYSETNIKKRQGRPKHPDNIIFLNNLEPLWPSGKPVAQAKLDNITSYMHLIPAADQPFYLHVTGDQLLLEDIDAYNVRALDFELESGGD